MQKTLDKSGETSHNESSRFAADNSVPALTRRAAKDSNDMAADEYTTGKSPAFQFYPKDFLNDRNVVLMSMQERGVYITLLCHAWEKPLPTRLDLLAKLCGVPLGVFKKLWPALGACFRQQGSDLVHPRLEREREKQAEYRRKQADKGRRSGQARGKGTGDEPETNRGSTGDEPRFNRSSGKPRTGTEPDTQPEGNSSSSSASSDFSQEHTERVPTRVGRGIGSGVMGGMLPRDHLRHAWCGRVCVPEFLHGRFVAAIGGADADARLRAFYVETFADVPDSQPVESDPTKFWPARVSARWPGQDAQEGSLTTALRRSSAEFLRS